LTPGNHGCYTAGSSREVTVSPKNKGKFGKAKSTEVPETDEFISGVDWIFRAL
jgi:hypothetical protein